MTHGTTTGWRKHLPVTEPARHQRWHWLTLSDFGIKQAYIALRAQSAMASTFKVGVFDSVVGYESFVGYRNPNYTRSYGYTIDAEDSHRRPRYLPDHGYG